LIEPNWVIPIHYDTFDVVKQDGPAWAKRVEASTDTKALALKPGGTFTLP